MNSKFLIYLGLFIGSTVGGYIPVLWGGSMLSMSSILLSAAGGILGIYVGFKLSDF
jgi:hypothetical protein